MSDETGGAGRPSSDGGGNGGPPAGGGRGGDSPGGRGESASETKAAPLREFEQKNDNPTRWPWWAQLILAIVALVIACGLLIVIPVYVASMRGGVESMDRSLMAMIAVFVGLTTMTISGMFLFMTFRIDRGARAEAGKVAEKVAGKEARRIAQRVVKAKVDAVKAKTEAVEKIRKAGDDAVKRVEEIRDHEVIPRVGAAGDDAVKRVEEIRDHEVIPKVGAAGDDAVKRVEEIRDHEVIPRVGAAGDDAVKRVEEIRDHEVIPKVGAAGDDAVEKVGEVRDHEAIPKARAAGEKVESETDQMIEEARRKIDAADIETLVNERLDAFLEQADGWPRRLFPRFRRRREPRP